MSQTMGLTRRGKVGRAGLGREGVRWLAEARRSEWEARGSGRWGGMVMEAPSFVTISRPRSGAQQDGMIRKECGTRKGQSFVLAEGKAVNSHNRD
jgi:hypothetical protein